MPGQQTRVGGADKVLPADILWFYRVTLTSNQGRGPPSPLKRRVVH